LAGKIPAGQASDFTWAAWDFLPTATDIALINRRRILTAFPFCRRCSTKSKPTGHKLFYWKLQSRNESQAFAWRIGRPCSQRPVAPLELYNLKTDRRKRTTSQVKILM